MITTNNNKEFGILDNGDLTPIIPLKDVVIFPNMAEVHHE